MLVKPPQGVTLIELLVAIALLGLIAALGIPNLAGILERQRALLLADRFAATLATARAIALAERRPVMIAPHGQGWRDGWQLCVDHDDDERCGRADRTVQQTPPAPSGALLQWTSSTTNDDIRFAPVGYSRRKTGGFVAGTMRIIVGNTIRLVTLSAQGRVRICAPSDDPACGPTP
ncbi:GspH/FimT family pseudopilin [Imbroritus primus]|uniref:GspH/FimT family pseudopilin n=1 Tax=Imbroritus primus TaxID=3058603 RepID=UPI003D161119